MRLLLCVCVVLGIAFPAFAQTVCYPTAQTRAALGQAHQEGVKGRGLAPNGWLIELWQTVSGSSFTITVTTPNGKTCVIASGVDWEWVILHVPETGQKS